MPNDDPAGRSAGGMMLRDHPVRSCLADAALVCPG
jgi:hypothetical protein